MPTPVSESSTDHQDATGAQMAGDNDVASEVPASSDETAPRTTDSTTDPKPAPRRSFADRVEAFLSRLSTRNNFWHRVCSLIWLPYAFRSGIRMKRLDTETFQAVLPYRKFNRNWYNAMAGAALVGNSEIAGGMYIFGVCGGAHTVVCKELNYRFLRPCFGPALYRIHPKGDIEALAATGEEFNITLTMDVVQQLPRVDKLPKVRDKRVGRVTITFHATPKTHQKAKRGSLKASKQTVREGEAIDIRE